MAFKRTISTSTVTEHMVAGLSPAEAFAARVRVIEAAGLGCDSDPETLRIQYRDHSGDTITVQYEDAG